MLRPLLTIRRPTSTVRSLAIHADAVAASPAAFAQEPPVPDDGRWRMRLAAPPPKRQPVA